MAPQYLRAYRETTDAGDTPGSPIRFVASTENVARDGLIIETDGWDLDNYKRNPVILWAHDLMGARPPIGRGQAFVEKRKLLVDVTFDQNDEFARMIEAKYRTGFLNAVSVGWDTKEFAPPKPAGGAPRVTKAELLEISAVPVGSDPGALKTAQAHALRSLASELDRLADDPNATRGAIPPHTGPMADIGMAWDAGAELKKAEGADQLRRMSAWVNSDADPETKGAYKLMHHLASGEVVWRGVSAAMARLMQGGTDIPDADRRGVYNHLARHYAQFEKEPPEFHSVGDASHRAAAPDHDHDPDDPDELWEDAAEQMVALYLPDTHISERRRRRSYHQLTKAYRLARREAPEWIDRDLLDLYSMHEVRGLFLEGEPDLFPELFREPIALGARVGQVLSKRNRDDIQQAIGLLNGVLRRAEKEAEQQPDPSESDDGRSLDDTLAALIALAPASSA